jgi:hypothetical protein
MPKLPVQRLDFLVDDREDPAKDRSRAATAALNSI